MSPLFTTSPSTQPSALQNVDARMDDSDSKCQGTQSNPEGGPLFISRAFYGIPSTFTCCYLLPTQELLGYH